MHRTFFQPLRALLLLFLISTYLTSSSKENNIDSLVTEICNKRLENIELKIENQNNVIQSSKELLSEKNDNMNRLFGFLQVIGVIVSLILAVGWVKNYQDNKKIRSELDLELKNSKAQIESVEKKINEADELLHKSTLLYRELQNSKQDIELIVKKSVNQDLQNKNAHITIDGLTESAQERAIPVERLRPIVVVRVEEMKNELQDNINTEINNMNWPKALNYISQYIRLDANNSSVFYKYGLCYFNLNRYQEAMEQFGNAISLKPNYCEAIQGKLACYKKLKMFNKEVSSLTLSLKELQCKSNPFDNL